MKLTHSFPHYSELKKGVRKSIGVRIDLHHKIWIFFRSECTRDIFKKHYQSRWSFIIYNFFFSILIWMLLSKESRQWVTVYGFKHDFTKHLHILYPEDAIHMLTNSLTSVIEDQEVYLLKKRHKPTSSGRWTDSFFMFLVVLKRWNA